MDIKKFYDYLDNDGKVVRRFLHPLISGDATCSKCLKIFRAHGFLDTLNGGHSVCPGDWVITNEDGETYPVKPDVFSLIFKEEDDIYDPWISIDDALPPLNKRFDAFNNRNEILPNHGAYIGTWDDEFRHSSMKINGITHWMPRPPNPKEKVQS